MNVWLCLAPFAGTVSWIGGLLILAKLRGEGYQYSDLFASQIYIRYLQIAPEHRWRRFPVFMVSLGAVSCIFLFLLGVIH